MRKHKPIEEGMFIYFKYSKENVEAHKRDPFWFPKIGTMGMVKGVEGEDILLIQWKLNSTSLDDIWRIEKYRVQRKYGPYGPRKNKKQNAD